MDGALGKGLAAAADQDPRALFSVLDQRARNAMSSIVKARQRALELIQSSYPQDARAEAVSALGDAKDASDGPDLFARRCNQACLEDFSARLSAPEHVEQRGELTHVRTVRGAELDLYRGQDGCYGIVWNTDTLRRESTRAFAELDLIRKNAELYEKQRLLK